ncbi:putative protein FAM10A4 [Microplitis demolitor]|uniref:putative protein FAM10A4 n=1 Tax=Microplitis demolitor TaxID=69319 RepID=UPI0004CDC8FD|nr:putative protein FAM10A4 [Microplitis demolitor]
MSLPFNQEHLVPLQRFVELCTANPQMLHLPDLAFVKKFIEHFGGKIPMQATGGAPSMEVPMQSQDEPEVMEPESDSESELELDMTNVVEPDNDPPQKMGDPTVQPTEEEISEAQAKRSEAVSAFVEKDFEKAIKLYTEAITLNPQAALLYAKRGQVYLEMKKPNACIRDCDRALELNPDSAAAHKFRGRANQLLGNFEEAATDLRLACKFDFDEQADEWLREVTPNARKIEEHKRKKERRAFEKAEKIRQEALKKAREEAKAREANSRPSQTDDGAKPSMNDFYSYLKDPEVLQAFQDPEVAAAFMEISSNPSNILKYQKNPKVMNLINKVASKFGGGAGMMPGGFPGMMGDNMPGGFCPGKPNPPAPDDDVGLD